MLGHGHFLFGDRDEAAGETALGFEFSLGRMSPFSLARSGVDSSDVLLEARIDLVERVEAGLGLGERVAPYSAILVLPPDNEHLLGQLGGQMEGCG